MVDFFTKILALQTVTLVIIEDEPVYREALETFFQGQAEFGGIQSAGSVEDFLEAAAAGLPPRLILLDIGLPGMSGLEGIFEIKERFPEADIVMLTADDDADRIFQAIQAGAISYLTKRASLQEIKDTLLTVSKGGAYMPPSIARKFFDYLSSLSSKQKSAILTEKQEPIVQGLVDGLSYKMIADKQTISIETVRDHIKKIYRKLQVNSKAEVIRLRMEGKI